MRNIIKGISISFILTLILLLIFAILLTYTKIQENTIKPVVLVIIGTSILIGSTIGNAGIKKNGLRKLKTVLQSLLNLPEKTKVLSISQV